MYDIRVDGGLIPSFMSFNEATREISVYTTDTDHVGDYNIQV